MSHFVAGMSCAGMSPLRGSNELLRSWDEPLRGSNELRWDEPLRGREEFAART